MAKVTAEKATAATAQLRQKAEEKDWTKEREYLGRTQKNLQGCVDAPLMGAFRRRPCAPQQVCRKHAYAGIGANTSLSAQQRQRHAPPAAFVRPPCHSTARKARPRLKSVMCVRRAAEKASTWVWAASSRTANVLRGDAVSVRPSSS